MLEVKNISCNREHRTLFHSLNFCLSAGQVLVIEGQNGSGKSTLLRMLAGLRQPDEGSISWNGEAINATGSSYLHQMSWLGHRNGLNESFTAKENLLLSANLTGQTTQDINTVLQLLGLDGYAHTLVRQFSTGMKRRLAFARLLMAKSRLWLLDEPESGLDKRGRVLFDDLVNKHIQANGMVVMSSHHDVRFDHQRLCL